MVLRCCYGRRDAVLQQGAPTRISTTLPTAAGTFNVASKVDAQSHSRATSNGCSTPQKEQPTDAAGTTPTNSRSPRKIAFGLAEVTPPQTTRRRSSIQTSFTHSLQVGEWADEGEAERVLRSQEKDQLLQHKLAAARQRQRQQQQQQQPEAPAQEPAALVSEEQCLSPGTPVYELDRQRTFTGAWGAHSRSAAAGGEPEPKPKPEAEPKPKPKRGGTLRLPDPLNFFRRYDADGDGFLCRDDLFEALKELELDLSAELYRQYVDCNFMYADADGDSKLSYEEFLSLHNMILTINNKFNLHDNDHDGFITKQAFSKIVKELHLNLDEAMCQNYINLNFRFVDRSFRGTISFGQFLACYANFLISHSVMESAKGKKSASSILANPVELDEVEEIAL